MNIKKIIEEHRAAQEAKEAQARTREAEAAAAQETQARIVRAMMKEKVLTLLQSASAEIRACGKECHVTHSEEERAGSTYSAWVVSTVSLVIDREKPAIAQLQFIGSATPENWHITAVAIIPGRQHGDDGETPFIGSPAAIERFVTARIERFVRTVYP